MFAFVSLMVGLIAVAIATYWDIRTREVPDWISYGLIAMAAGLRLIAAVLYHDLTYLWEGFLGLLAFTAVGLIMYYAGQWGGGDSKLIIGVGLIFGFVFDWHNTLLGFFLNLLFAGAFYGLLWSGALSVLHRKAFGKEYKKRASRPAIKYLRWGGLSALIILVIAAFVLKDMIWLIPLVLLLCIGNLTVYAYLFVKSVETVCMLKQLPVAKLTEGDWIVNDVIVHGKRITGPKDLGITKEQIAALKKLKVKKVLVKEGIPFVPAFLIAYAFTLLFGNILFLIFH